MDTVVNAKDFDQVLEDILANKATFPNLDPVDDPTEALKLISQANGPIHKPYKAKLDNRTIYYPKIFTRAAGMASKFDGRGVVLSTYGVHKFAICHHDYDESGARHERGWHPARCRKCGFDASIDSGD